MKKKVIIMGAAGRDFHNFNVFFRDNEEYEVVAFTATQIPNIEGRKYPAELAGSLYPNGIDIYPESQLDELIKKFNVDLVVFSYSDVAHEYVMHKASQAMVAGASFMLLGPKQTMVESSKPVIAVCAGRTGSGKSQTTRRVVEILRDLGKKVVVVRHPMPYGDLVAQKVQRFATYDDLDYHKCTIEEREEYEPHIDRGAIVYAGVDYEAILRQAEQEADVVIWDGGNNDFPFYKPDLMITVVDPHRPGHEIAYHPGEVNVRMADVVVINKEDTANFEDIEEVRENVRHVNPQAIHKLASVRSKVNLCKALPQARTNKAVYASRGKFCDKGTILIAAFCPIIRSKVVKLVLSKKDGILLVWYSSERGSDVPYSLLLCRKLDGQSKGEDVFWLWVPMKPEIGGGG